MKKIFLIILFFIFLLTFLKAQPFISINSNIALSTKGTKEVDNGLGVYASLGYIFKKNIELNGDIGNTWFISINEKYKILSLKTNTKYYFLHKSIKPFLGFGFGYFHKSFKGPFESFFIENGIGINPSIGTLFSFEKIKRLHINAEFIYSKIYTKHQISLININFGILYLLNKTEVNR